MPDIDWFSFIAGVITATVLLWAVSAVWAWLKKVFQPPGSQPFKQRAASTLRNLITALLVLAVIAVAAYIAYSVLFKP